MKPYADNFNRDWVKDPPVGLLILDGPDCCGKTTLSNYLNKTYGAIEFHCTWNQELSTRMFDYQTETLVEALKFTNEKLVVIDRLWPSEAIYADVFREGTPWPQAGRLMDRVIMKHAGMYVLCIPYMAKSHDGAVARYLSQVDAKHPYNEEQYRYLLERYQWLWTGQKVEHNNDYTFRLMNNGGVIEKRWRDWTRWSIESEGQSVDWSVKHILRALQHRRDKQFPSALDFNNYDLLGHAEWAKWLFISGQESAYKWPFYDYPLFFNDALAEINFDEVRGMYTYANSKFIAPLVNHYKLKPVVIGSIGDELRDFEYSQILELTDSKQLLEVLK